MANFDQLILGCSAYLSARAMQLTRDREAAKDLIQDTLCRALLNRGKFKEGTNMKAWLLTIMKNLYINLYWRKETEKKVLSQVRYYCSVGVVRPQNGQPDGGEKEVLLAMHAIPEIFSIPVRMYSEGYKYQEIADKMNIALGTTKSRIHLGRKLLRQKLG